MRIPGYVLDERLYEGQATRVYAGVREADRMPVVAKMVTGGTRDLHEECKLLQRLSGPGIVEALGMYDTDEGPALLQRFFGSESLAQTIKRDGAFPTKLVLAVGQQLAQILTRVHSMRVLHRDIKPDNILYDAATGAVAIADFGISAELPVGARVLAVRDLVGTPSYVAPEQTGRTRDGCDFRSDLYSLGITLYHLATGSLPFESNDMLELVSAHLSQVPELPTVKNAAVPPMVGAILMKLCAKSPAERYQSARGLHADLKRCAETLQADGGIPDFELGQSDLRLPQPPSGLHGRTAEYGQLAQCYTQADRGTPSLVLITGREGTGCSALARALVREHSAAPAAVARFKSEADRPLSAISDALASLAGRLLLLDDALLSRTRDQLLAQLGQVGQVVIDIAPALGDVLGPQPKLPELGVAEAHARVRHGLGRLMAGLGEEHVPILALHDFQYADPASVDLVEALLAEVDCRSLVVLSARDVSDFGTLAQHPGATLIELGPLSPPAVVSWVASALEMSPAQVTELATVLHDKSGGNAGLLLSLLEHLVEQSVVDRVDGNYTWSLDAVRAERTPPTLAALVAGRVAELPQAQLEALACVASCDEAIDLDAVTAMLSQEQQQVSRTLAALEREGLVTATTQDFAVAHASVQRAVMDSVASARVKRMVARLAMHLLRTSSESELAKNAFRIAKALSMGEPELASEERIRAAKVYATAGTQVTGSMAYDTAARFFERGQALLTHSDAQVQRALAFELAIGCGRSLMMLGQNDRAEDVFKSLCARELAPAEIGIAYSGRSDNRSVVSDRAGAIAVGLEGLTRLGIKLPPDSSALRPLPLLLANEHRLAQLTNADHLERPEATDARALAALRILSTLTTPAFLSRRNNLYLLVVETAMALILKYGHVRQTASILGAHSTVVLGGLKKYEKARRSYEAALALQSERPAPEFYGRSALALYYPLQPWFGSWKESAEQLTEAVHRTNEVGDPLFAALCGAGATTLHAMSGLPMDRMCEVLEGLEGASRADRDAGVTLRNTLHLVRKMAAGEPLLQADLDRITDVPLEAAALRNDPMVNLGLAVTVSGHEAQVRAWLDEIRPTFDKISFALPQTVNLWLLDGLFAAKDARLGQRKRLRVALAMIAQLRKLQKQTRTTHHEASIGLLEAEVARAQGQLERASGLYARAAGAAAALELSYLVAYIMEQRAEMLEQMGLSDEAAHFYREAAVAYQRWGHFTKVRMLEQARPELRTMAHAGVDGAQTVGHRTQGMPDGARPTLASADGLSVQGTATRSINEALDLATVLKISQEISTQLQASGVVRSVLSGIAQNAGAERVLFIQRTSDGEESAYGELASGQYRELGIPLEDYAEVPSSLLKLLRRTRKPIVIGDALADAAYASDPFVQASGCRSVAGIPIIKKGELSGFVVLENRLAPGAFTNALIGLTQALVSQAAISLDNASLYEDMEGRVRERTAALHARNAEMRLVLDNVVQGLAIADLTGKLAPESSAILHEWFPEGLPETLGGLFACDSAADFLFESGWEQLLDDFLPPELCIDQLPARLHKGEQVFDISWEPINDGAGKMTRMLVVLSDITEVLRSQEAEAKQREQMALFQRLSSDRSGVIEFVNDASNIVREVQRAGHSGEVEKRLVHTLKGNAGFFGLNSLMALCHELESTLLDEQRNLTAEERGKLSQAWSAIEEQLAPFVEVGSDIVHVRKADYEAALLALQHEGSPVADELLLWQLEPLRTRFQRVGEQASKLAERLEKGPIEVDVQHGDVLIDSELWAPFWSAFVHAVRNAIDHGLEPAHERAELGKGIATIGLHAYFARGSFVFELSDDGRGISWDRVRMKAADNGLPCDSHDDLVAALFSDGISTKDTADEMSGRGVGMGALRDACSAMKAKIGVESSASVGTTWRFTFPSTVAHQPHDPSASLHPNAQCG